MVQYQLRYARRARQLCRRRIRLAGKPEQTKDIELGAGEARGPMTGSGGVLALQAY